MSTLSDFVVTRPRHRTARATAGTNRVDGRPASDSVCAPLRRGADRGSPHGMCPAPDRGRRVRAGVPRRLRRGRAERHLDHGPVRRLAPAQRRQRRHDASERPPPTPTSGRTSPAPDHAPPPSRATPGRSPGGTATSRPASASPTTGGPGRRSGSSAWPSPRPGRGRTAACSTPSGTSWKAASADTRPQSRPTPSSTATRPTTPPTGTAGSPTSSGSSGPTPATSTCRGGTGGLVTGRPVSCAPTSTTGRSGASPRTTARPAHAHRVHDALPPRVLRVRHPSEHAGDAGRLGPRLAVTTRERRPVCEAPVLLHARGGVAR